MAAIRTQLPHVATGSGGRLAYQAGRRKRQGSPVLRGRPSRGNPGPLVPLAPGAASDRGVPRLAVDCRQTAPQFVKRGAHPWRASSEGGGRCRHSLPTVLLRPPLATELRVSATVPERGSDGGLLMR